MLFMNLVLYVHTSMLVVVIAYFAYLEWLEQGACYERYIQHSWDGTCYKIYEINIQEIRVLDLIKGWTGLK